MADLIEPRLLKGFRDLLPSQMLARQHMLRTIEQVLQIFGFLPLETPVLEYADILHGKLGDEGEKLLYEFTDHGDRQVAMRYDLTVPLARVIAQYPELPKPFKRYQVGPVWRADNTQRGRYREFYQFDLDIVGTDSPLADAEILVAMQEVLLTLGVKNFKIRVNDRRYLQAIAEQVGLSTEQLAEFYTGLDKWDKIGGLIGVVGYWQDHGLPQSCIDQLAPLFQSPDLSHHPSQSTIESAIELGLQPQSVQIDPTIVRGLDYYTGIVFETTLTEAPQFGSVFSGGRYDGLVARFSKQEFAAVGASVGVDRLLAALEELGLGAGGQKTPNKVFVTIFNTELESQSLNLTSALRRAGIATEMAFEAINLGKQLKVAAAKNIPWAIIIGPDEAAQHQATIRNLMTGQEQKLSEPQVVSFLRDNIE